MKKLKTTRVLAAVLAVAAIDSVTSVASLLPMGKYVPVKGRIRRWESL